MQGDKRTGQFMADNLCGELPRQSGYHLQRIIPVTAQSLIANKLLRRSSAPVTSAQEF